MVPSSYPTRPSRSTYDVVIVGGAMMGSATAWFLSDNPDFDGTVLVVERDPSYEACSTAHTNSCMRQQFSEPLNIRISQFAAEFVTSFREQMGGDVRVPELSVQSYGYLYLADTEAFAQTLRANQKIQNAHGVPTEILTVDEIKAKYPFYDLGDIQLGSINRQNEGYFDGGAVFEWFRRISRERGVEYVAGEVTGMSTSGDRVADVTLSSGDAISCGHVVNAAGPRGANVARMVGFDLPVEPRKRFAWVFTAETPLSQDLPLTIDPSGVHFRQDGPESYLAGCPADPDPAVPFDDFAVDHGRWESHVWPVLARRIPQFEAIRVVTEWAGHYAYNTLDQNAVVGAHPEVQNFFFQNGFSGHGLQQSPAMGRGVSELITYGAYRSLDLSPLGYERVLAGEPFRETAII